MYITLMSSLVCSDPGELGLLSNGAKLFLLLISKQPNKPQKEKQFPVKLRIRWCARVSRAIGNARKTRGTVSTFKTAIGKI